MFMKRALSVAPFFLKRSAMLLAVDTAARRNCVANPYSSWLGDVWVRR